MKTYIELEVEVTYDYQPYEAMTRDYPGSPAYFEIQRVDIVKGDKRLDIVNFLTKEQIEAIEEELENYGRGEE